MSNTNVYDAEIKVNNWVKTIKINEQGDTISINIGDASLSKNIMVLLADLQKISEDLSNLNDKFTDDQLLEKLDYMNLKISESSEKIDLFFGAGTCMKVFKTNTPYIDDIIDFITQICELIEKFTGEKLENFENTKKKFIDKQKKRKKG